MPKKDPPLSAEEKQAIFQRHQELVDKINTDLPDEMKIDNDPHLKERLEDEKEVEEFQNQVKLDLNEELVQSEVKVASSDAPTKQMEIEEEILNEK